MENIEKNSEQAPNESGELNSESVSVEKLLEVSDEELKTKYGIENPKNWKSYQRALHKEQRERAEEREKFQKLLEERENAFKQAQEQFKSVIPKPQEEKFEEPEEPQPPNVSLADDPDAWTTYYRKQREYNKQVREYDRKMHQKEIGEIKDAFGKTEQQLQQEQRLREQQRNLEATKAIAMGRWGTQGHKREDFDELWKTLTETNGEKFIDAIGELVKYRKNKGGNIDDLKGQRDQRGQLSGASPIGQGGGVGVGLEEGSFTKSNNHADLYKKKGT